MTKDIHLYQTTDGKRIIVYLDEILTNKDNAIYVCGIIGELNTHIGEDKVVDILDTEKNVIATMTTTKALKAFLEARDIFCA